MRGRLDVGLARWVRSLRRWVAMVGGLSQIYYGGLDHRPSRYGQSIPKIDPVERRGHCYSPITQPPLSTTLHQLIRITLASCEALYTTCHHASPIIHISLPLLVGNSRPARGSASFAICAGNLGPRRPKVPQRPDVQGRRCDWRRLLWLPQRECEWPLLLSIGSTEVLEDSLTPGPRPAHRLLRPVQTQHIPDLARVRRRPPRAARQAPPALPSPRQDPDQGRHRRVGRVERMGRAGRDAGAGPYLAFREWRGGGAAVDMGGRARTARPG